MVTRFISDIEIQGVKDFIHRVNRNRFSEITAGLIDVLPDTDLEMAITYYIEKQIKDGMNFEDLPENLQMFYAMHEMERSLATTKALNSGRASQAEKLLFSRMTFRAFLENKDQNLAQLAIKGYLTMGPVHIGRALTNLFKNYNETGEKVLMFVFEKNQTVPLRAGYIRKNPKGFITGTDFMVY